MSEGSVKKRVDESWKEQAELEKHAQPKGSAQGAPAVEAVKQQSPEAGESLEARFDMFPSGLAMEAFVAMGDMPHPSTRKQSTNLAQAKYLINLLGILEDKTRGNLTADEEKLLKDILYQLRMRYLAKSKT